MSIYIYKYKVCQAIYSLLYIHMIIVIYINIYIYIHLLHSISMIQIISWNCVDILDVCVECVLPSSHHLTSKTCLCLSDADFLQQKCLLALEVEHPIGHYFLDCSAWPRSGLRTKDMAAWCNTLWSWCRLKKTLQHMCNKYIEADKKINLMLSERG